MAAIVLLWFFSGVFAGLFESLHYHYASFKRIFKRASDQYWNPDISWMNKYRVDIITDGNGLPHSISSIGKPRFLFSLTLLRSFTDGSHLVQALSGFLAAIGWALAFLVLHSFGGFGIDAFCQNFILILYLLIVHYIAKYIGFFLAYSFI